MTGVAFAAAPAGGAGAAGGLASFIPLILIFVVFYFLLIRPQAKQHQAFLSDLKKGNRVVTKGGVHGVITSLTDTVVSLEIAKDVVIKVSRDAIGGPLSKDGTVPAKKETKSAGG
ncbi:MAG: preprotein translocase subunit YajC [Desulforhopalus sp.]